MARVSPIESHIAVVKAPDSGPDTFTNEKPLTSQQGGRTVFGGLLVSQAVSAANATVASDFHVYSSQSSFLRPVTPNANGKVLYRVERIADGRSYATRLVRAITPDACVYTAIISFQNSKAPANNSLTYDVPMPDLGSSPEDIPKDATTMINAQYAKSEANQSDALQPFILDEDPFDWRPSGLIVGEDPTETRIRGFVRSDRRLLSKSTSAHLAALAYLSDEMLLGVAVFSNPDMVGKGGKNITLAASLTHNLSFHDPTVQVDEWMVAERETAWGANGRVLIIQRMWNLKSGRLVLTTEQEALIRLKNARL